MDSHTLQSIVLFLFVLQERLRNDHWCGCLGQSPVCICFLRAFPWSMTKFVKKQILFSFLRFFVVWKLCTCSFSCCTLRRSSHISSLCWHPLIHHPLPMKRDSRQSYDRSIGNQFKIRDRRNRWSFQTALHNIPIILIRHQVRTPICETSPWNSYSVIKFIF